MLEFDTPEWQALRNAKLQEWIQDPYAIRFIVDFADTCTALENGSDNDKVFAYVLRDWYMEFVAYVVYLTRGRDYMRDTSMEIRQFFTHHETLEEYKEKMA